jgi:membrane protease subunit HflK
MERLFEGKDKIIVDADAGGSGVIPYLPLNELTKGSQASSDRAKGELQ